MTDLQDVSQFLAELSEEQIGSAARAVDERQYNRQRTPLDFDAAVERLRSCRDILLSTIEDDFFSTLPQGIQNELAPILSSISQSLSMGRLLVRSGDCHLLHYTWRSPAQRLRRHSTPNWWLPYHLACWRGFRSRNTIMNADWKKNTRSGQTSACHLCHTRILSKKCWLSGARLLVLSCIID